MPAVPAVPSACLRMCRASLSPAASRASRLSQILRSTGAGRDSARSNCGAGQGKAGRRRAGQGGAGQGREGQGRGGQSREGGLRKSTEGGLRVPALPAGHPAGSQHISSVAPTAAMPAMYPQVYPPPTCCCPLPAAHWPAAARRLAGAHHLCLAQAAEQNCEQAGAHPAPALGIDKDDEGGVCHPRAHICLGANQVVGRDAAGGGEGNCEWVRGV